MSFAVSSRSTSSARSRSPRPSCRPSAPPRAASSSCRQLVARPPSPTSRPTAPPSTRSRRSGDALRRRCARSAFEVAIIEPGSVATPIWQKSGNEAAAARDISPRRSRRSMASAWIRCQRSPRRPACAGSIPDDVADAVEHALTADEAKDALCRRARGEVSAQSPLGPPRSRHGPIDRARDREDLACGGAAALGDGVDGHRGEQDGTGDHELDV